MSDQQDLELRMHRAMTARSVSAPAGVGLADRIVVAATTRSVETTPDTRRLTPGWRDWIMPVVAAIGVAILVGAVLIGNRLFRADEQQPGHPSTPPAPTASVVPPPISSAAPKQSPSPATSQSGSMPPGFRVVDLTWISLDEGWALGTAPCAVANCRTVAHTTDGGLTWQPTSVLATNSIQALRFANRSVGYAFGVDALFMSTDGGHTWARQAGGAVGLETANGTVLRLASSHTGCPGACDVHLQRSAVGGTSWQDLELPGRSGGFGAALARSGNVVAITFLGHPAGGAMHQQSTLITSTDNGNTWTNRGEPCPQAGTDPALSEVDSGAAVTGPDGSIVSLCTPRSGNGAQFVTVSTDGGARFTAGPASLGAARVEALGAASASVLFLASDWLYRSSDAGRTWQRVQQNSSQAPGNASWIGFENSTTGRVISAGVGTAPPVIWTTRDAGLTWTAHTFE
jgi:photosystem II stability/assembly factor-like uncharacterized protein